MVKISLVFTFGEKYNTVWHLVFVIFFVVYSIFRRACISLCDRLTNSKVLFVCDRSTILMACHDTKLVSV